MGNITSYVEPLFGFPAIGQRLRLGATKRKIEEVEKEDSSNFDSVLKTPKRRKLWSTSQYIYKTLFEDGKESDVTVVALGQQWHLHKVYLCQKHHAFGTAHFALRSISVKCVAIFLRVYLLVLCDWSSVSITRAVGTVVVACSLLKGISNLED